jgi:hypothetical protein
MSIYVTNINILTIAMLYYFACLTNFLLSTSTCLRLKGLVVVVVY